MSLRNCLLSVCSVLILSNIASADDTPSHYLRIYMGQLRHKLESDPARPRYLLTEAGVGYRLYEGEN
jgi:DNA-binding response OmpR family regulator